MSKTPDGQSVVVDDSIFVFESTEHAIMLPPLVGPPSFVSSSSYCPQRKVLRWQDGALGMSYDSITQGCSAGRKSFQTVAFIWKSYLAISKTTLESESQRRTAAER